MTDIKKKRITDLPQATTIEKLLTLGVDNTGKSVKVPIELLKGNKGDKGEPGEVTQAALAKKADAIRTSDNYKVVYTADGTIPSVDLLPYAKITTEKGIVVRTADGMIPTVDISGKVDKTVIYNITQQTGLTYTDKQTAHNAVPSELRKKGQVLLFRLSTGDWLAEQFTGENISDWNQNNYWKPFGTSSRVFDGGRADTVYGGSRTIDCGNAQ